MKSILLITLLLASFQAFASGKAGCKAKGFRQLNYSASVDKKISFAYRDAGALREDRTPGILINECEKAGQQRKSLMIGFGPINHGLNASETTTEYTDNIGAEQCVIANSPFPNQPEEERKKIFMKKQRFINTCVERRVKHFGTFPLRARAEQQGCKLKNISKQEAIIEGNVCFFNIFPDSEFHFSHKIKEECTDLEFLAKNDLHPMEVNAFATVNIVGDQSGTTNDLVLLDSRVIRFQVDPSKEQMPISDDWGIDVPQYPAHFSLKALDLAQPKITQFEDMDSSQLELPYVVSNLCERKCDENGCEPTVCDFSMPLVGEVEIKKYKANGRATYIDSWYGGGVTPSNWQGFLASETRNLDKVRFEEGERYSIEINFRDPKFDYMMFNRSLNPMFRPLPGIPTVNFATNLANGIPVIDPLMDMFTIDEVNIINELSDTVDYGPFSQGDGLVGLTNHTYWPPYYDATCSAGSKNCKKVSNASFAKYKVEFTVKGKNRDSGELILGDVSYNRESRVFGNLTKKNFQFPRIKCPWDL